ncbi:MAG: hypothetical protein IPK83_03955 [Planctomycetes bacterium]|nr:hypothetical protein [Planctomycetota bacterium]
MFFRVSKVASLALLGVASVAFVGVGIGCGSANPFLAAQFNTVLADFFGVNPPGPPPANNNNNNNNNNATTLASVCDLPAAQRSIRMEIRNSAPQTAEFSMTFVVSAGVGGFVCDDELENYLDAGYADAIVPNSGATLPIGCDVISLLSGTRILTLEYGVNQGAAANVPANASGDDTLTGAPVALRRRDNGGLDIPIPEIIVLGNDDANYICIGGANAGDLCTQRGFRYISGAGLTVGKSPEASRIQGTVCAENFGSAPEWRLDKTLDTITQPFQFGRGGAIVVRILNRANDPLDNPRNQVVWTVTDVDGDTLHPEDP